MNSAPGTGIAVVSPRGSDESAALEAYLHSNGLRSAARYAARDLDELDAAVRSGTIGRVVFQNADELLVSVWDEDIALEEWHRHGVQIEFAERPAGSSDALLREVLVSWQRWNRHRRRRQAIAGAALSAIVLAAAFLANWLV